ncbi:MAG: hypothetical protein RQ729_02670 [Wenzhouxiangellaceae bacterium]|nr:hypothetical protein [Wenzhouxiangellaceae bacterium]
MIRTGIVLVVCTACSLAGAQEWSLDWYTVEGGGEVLSETADGDWQLSGTIGQWDATASQQLAAPGWTLSGGFWPATVAQTERLFADGFE